MMEEFDNLTLNKVAREIRQKLTTKVSLSTSHVLIALYSGKYKYVHKLYITV